MKTVSQWLDMFKKYSRIRSDYALAAHWGVCQSRISQYRKGRLKLPLAFVLEIAETLDRDPLEIIVSLAYPKARERDKAGLKDVYFRVALRGITNEMAANSRTYGWRPGRSWKR